MLLARLRETFEEFNGLFQGEALGVGQGRDPVRCEAGVAVLRLCDALSQTRVLEERRTFTAMREA